MKKIKTLFVRDPEDRRWVLPEVEPGCEWVLAGEGVATRKYDGTCMKYDGEQWWARREVKPGKAAPEGYVVEQHDEVTGKTVGWEPAGQSAYAKYVTEAVGSGGFARSFTPGTYELVGPKVNGNPEEWGSHHLILHGMTKEVDAPRDFDGLRAFLATYPGEGLVWHHPDGRMVKIKRRDFPSRKDSYQS